MKFSIGFGSAYKNSERGEAALTATVAKARRSLVRVYFPARNMTLSYYNDLFELKVGDLVYVEGKLEGLRGRVEEVSHNFKIKLSDYKRVIGRAEADVRGTFYYTKSHMLSFDAWALPYSMVRTWFMPPEDEDEEYVVETDDSGFLLSDLNGMELSPAIAARGLDYYRRNRVRYICLDGKKGRAIVEGTEVYELEFEYSDGEILNLICSCFCTYPCKHEYAAMLLLKEVLEKIERDYSREYRNISYFAAIDKLSFSSIALGDKETGSITLS